MKTVIIGQKWLAAETLKSFVAKGINVIGIAPEGIDRFSETADDLGLPVFGLREIPSCDLIVAAHCHRFIPEEIRNRSRLGVLAYHPSLLPRHRGRDAIYWALAMGDPVTGGTAYWMDDGADTGPIEAQEWCFIQPGDTPLSLWKRDLGPMGVHLLTDTAVALANGRANGPQSHKLRP